MEHMRRLRPRALVWLSVLFAAVLAGVFAASVSGSHAEQKWAGFWHFTHLNSPTVGLQGGFAFQHQLDEENAADLLEAIGGVACPEPTDYFTGAYTTPDTEDLLPNTGYDDTGKIRGCTMGDRLHLRGRYESNSNPAAAGDIELTLLESDLERWNGIFTIDGDPQNYTWTGFFQGHFDDGAEHVSDPPYGEPPPEEPEPPAPGPAPPGPVASEMCEGKQATITPNPDAPAGLAISGTAADDVVVGTDGPDRILGLGGNDLICGFGGDDELIGAEGEDRIQGGLGNDLISGDDGEDYLAGDYPSYQLDSPTGGDDRISGNEGNDVIESGPGNDTASGGSGEDKVYGNIITKPLSLHPESAVVGPDNDLLLGDERRDQIIGGRGNDTLDGGGGDDLLEALAGTDILKGGRGTDALDGGAGNDRIDGGKGDEGKRGGLFGDIARYFIIEAPVNVNLSSGRVAGGQGRDRILEIESVAGSIKTDVIRGSRGPDYLSGGLAGDDDIYGLGGNDMLFGSGGDNLLLGGPGVDSSFGGSGFDRCGAERRAGCERLIVGAGR